MGIERKMVVIVKVRDQWVVGSPPAVAQQLRRTCAVLEHSKDSDGLAIP